jgi:exodeoxyribonuclease VII large subunit
MAISNHAPDPQPESRKIFPLSKLSASIAVQVERSFPGEYWITAEVNKLNFYPHSGHCYPTLVEKSEGRIIAELKAFIQSSRYRAMQAKFVATLGEQLSDGMQILFKCKVGFHALHGLSLNILDIEPAYTMGEMARMRLEAIAKLKAEGILDTNKSLHLPLLLKRIAVVSVETSKGWRDFKSVLDGSIYSKAIEVSLYPALLQGDQAVSSILGALENIHLDCHKYDCVAIIRGGGGETGLDCYDNYKLAKAVCLFPIPVLTGIGHATNLTVVEQVAYSNLITPTALARFVTDGFSAFAERLSAATRGLRNLGKGFLPLHIHKLEMYRQALSKVSLGRLRFNKEQLNSSTRRIEVRVKSLLEHTTASLNYHLPARLGEAYRRLAVSQIALLDITKNKLTSAAASICRERNHKIAFLAEKVRLLDPAQTLKRGYSITLHKGKPVKSAAEINQGDTIETIFAKGKTTSTVITTSND